MQMIKEKYHRTEKFHIKTHTQTQALTYTKNAI